MKQKVLRFFRDYARKKRPLRDGDFSRRLHAFAKQKGIPVIHCEAGVRKHELAEERLPVDPLFQGLFLILVAKSPALVWEVKPCKNGQLHLERKTP